MSKLGRVTTKTTYGLLGLVMNPLYNQIKKERRLEMKKWDVMNNQASQDALAPQNFTVHQPQDTIVHIRSIW